MQTSLKHTEDHSQKCKLSNQSTHTQIQEEEKEQFIIHFCTERFTVTEIGPYEIRFIFPKFCSLLFNN